MLHVNNVNVHNQCVRVHFAKMGIRIYSCPQILLTQNQDICIFKGRNVHRCQTITQSAIRRYVRRLTLISFVRLLHQGYCQCGLLVQPPHQFQERAVGPGSKPGPAESSPTPADSAESWHLARHRSWAARCHKGVQVAVPQPPLELSDHPQPGRFWQNCQPWWASLVFVMRNIWTFLARM